MEVIKENMPKHLQTQAEKCLTFESMTILNI